MKAIGIEQYGGPEVLIHKDIEVPEAKEGEVLFKVRCAGINFMDIHTRQGKYKASRTYPVRLPCTLGMEGSGDVAKLGAGVTSFELGTAWRGAFPGVHMPSTRSFLPPVLHAFQIQLAMTWLLRRSFRVRPRIT